MKSQVFNVSTFNTVSCHAMHLVDCSRTSEKLQAPPKWRSLLQVWAAWCTANWSRLKDVERLSNETLIEHALVCTRSNLLKSNHQIGCSKICDTNSFFGWL